MKVLILISFLIVSSSCYIIDFENGDGHLKLESNRLLNGQVVHEPEVEHVIKSLSGIRYKEPHSEMTKKKYRHPDARDKVQVEYNDYDVPRIFITNINKNLNSNDLAQENEAESVQERSYSNNKRGKHDQRASYAY